MQNKSHILSILVLILLFSCSSKELVPDIPPGKEIEKYPTKSLMHFMYGEIYRADGNYIYANMEYRRALEYDTTTTILNAIGETYRQMGKHRNAADYFEKALSLDPGDAVAKHNVLDLYMKEMRYEDAVKILTASLEEEPDNADYLQRLAECYRYLENYDLSLETLDKLIDIRPDHPWAHIFAAEIMLETGRIADAAPYLEKVVRRVPPNNELYEFWVRSLYESKNLPGMLSALEFWLDKNPETLAPYFLYIDYSYQVHHFEKGDSVLAIIKDRWRENGRISYFQGISAMEREEADSVWFYFNRAETSQNVSADLYLYYGLWHWEKGYLDRAETIADRAIRSLGPATRWLHMKAMINAEKENYSKAEEILLQILRADSNNVNVKEDLANIYVELNNADRADYLYKEILEDFPDNPSILNNYAYILAKLDRDLDQATKMVNKALKEGKNAAYCDTKAWILYRQKKYKKALSWVNKALEYEDISSELLFHKGRILQALNKKDKAREAYEQSLKINPGFKPSVNALEEIK